VCVCMCMYNICICILCVFVYIYMYMYISHIFCVSSLKRKKEVPHYTVFSFSSYRHPSICILFSSRFTSYNKRRNNILVKAAALRITLNIDTTPIPSKTRTHPSHEFSNLSSLNKKKVRIPNLGQKIIV
jgi:hypothetical protein